MLDKVTLEGDLIRLEPLAEKHKSQLCEAIQDGELWKLFFTLVPHPDNIDAFYEKAQSLHQFEEGLAFATINKATGRVVGSTRFLNSDLAHHRTEIGFTFLAKSAQKTRINTEAKLLMLTHAFETLKLNRVAFLTHYLNQKSQQAILRLGAKDEGLLRNHMVMPDGKLRDSKIYSIIANEWPGIKQNLQFKLAQ